MAKGHVTYCPGFRVQYANTDTKMILCAESKPDFISGRTRPRPGTGPQVELARRALPVQGKSDRGRLRSGV